MVWDVVLCGCRESQNSGNRNRGKGRWMAQYVLQTTQSERRESVVTVYRTKVLLESSETNVPSGGRVVEQRGSQASLETKRNACKDKDQFSAATKEMDDDRYERLRADSDKQKSLGEKIAGRTLGRAPNSLTSFMHN